MKWVSLLCVACVAILLAGCEPIIVGEPGPADNQSCPNGTCPNGQCPNGPYDPWNAPPGVKGPYATVPPLDLPIELRSSNYNGGSCLHAAFQDCLRQQHMEALAADWRSNYGGGASISDIAAICNRYEIDFAYTVSGDEQFLEWASRTRRGAAVYWMGGIHAITFCGFVDNGRTAVVVDNNSRSRVQRIPREDFLAQWRGSGGCAVTAVYSPTPPRPWI